RWRWTQSEQRIAAWNGAARSAMLLRAEVPDHAPDSGEQQNEADDAPYNGCAGGTIPHKLLVRPILCVSDILSRTIGTRRPCCPPEESRHLVLLGSIRKRAGGNGVFVAPFAIYVAVVGGQFVEGSGAILVEDDGVRGRVVSIAAGQLRQSALQRSSRFRWRCGIA